MIITKDSEAGIAFFEALGFEKRHTKTDVEGGANVTVVMKDANGNHVNVAKADGIPQDHKRITARCILRPPTVGFAEQNGRDAKRAVGLIYN